MEIVCGFAFYSGCNSLTHLQTSRTEKTINKIKEKDENISIPPGRAVTSWTNEFTPKYKSQPGRSQSIIIANAIRGADAVMAIVT
ncbi:hypothetical protein PoB_007416200 [Plakobranchus ocellatus]|uniref:Uncharacterized protein n=1 Tax=Plakobranchus ocellatus TaxID=259542 RepID=A0AAV4DTJ3_9GAST|nr:hypothetical protein PoB_007416200 [Plakobranchus ocellatus]